MLLSIPKLGPLLFNLLFPVFFAGLMLGCRALEQGKKLDIGYLFAGFRENASSLVTVGGIYLVGMLIVLAVIFSSPTDCRSCRRNRPRKTSPRCRPRSRR